MPATVRDVHVENLLSGRRFLIEWDLNNTSESVTSYEVHRSNNETQGYAVVATITSPTNQYIDKVPYTFGINYFYKVLARDGTGILTDINDAAAVQDTTFDSFEEKPFRATTVTFDSFVTGGALAGVQDTINITYTSTSLYRFNTTEIFRNGVALVRGVGYTENNDQTTITMTIAPAPADTLTINFLKV